MKVIREKLNNFPDEPKPVTALTAVEGQAVEDEITFDKRKEETEKEVEKQVKLPVDGAPKQPKPEPVKYPKIKMTEAYGNGVREYTDQFYDMIEADMLDTKSVLESLIYWVSEDDIKRYMEVNEMFYGPEDLEDSATYDESLTEGYFDKNNLNSISDVLNMVVKDAPAEFAEVAQYWISDNDIIGCLQEVLPQVYDDPALEEIYTRFPELANKTECLEEEVIDEDINVQHAADTVRKVILETFGIDTDVEAYKDSDQSKAVVIQFVIPKEENDKIIYDELKEKLYKRFANDVNISCKTFSSPNLEENRVEYKIKVLVIKERKNKYGASKGKAKYNSGNHHTNYNKNESLTEEAPSYSTVPTGNPNSMLEPYEYGKNGWKDDDEIEEDDDLYTKLFKELSSDHEGNDTGRRLPSQKAYCTAERATQPIYSNEVRYKAEDSQTATTNKGADVELSVGSDDDNTILKITPKAPKTFEFAEKVAEAYKDFADVGLKYVPHYDANPPYAEFIFPIDVDEDIVAAHDKAYKKSLKA